MPADAIAIARARLEASIAVKQRLLDEGLEAIAVAADLLVTSYRSGGKALFFGNGGSASDALHLAAELVGRFERERRALPALALTANTSALSAIGNDYGFEHIFARQVEGLCQPNDIAIGLSTSGRSANVAAGLAAAQRCGARTIAMTGRDAGPVGTGRDAVIAIPSNDTARIQEGHITVGHILCELIEHALFPDAPLKGSLTCSDA